MNQLVAAINLSIFPYKIQRKSCLCVIYLKQYHHKINSRNKWNNFLNIIVGFAYESVPFSPISFNRADALNNLMSRTFMWRFRGEERKTKKILLMSLNYVCKLLSRRSDYTLWKGLRIILWWKRLGTYNIDRIFTSGSVDLSGVLQRTIYPKRMKENTPF